MPVDVPVLTVADATFWRQWLSREHAKSKGVWLTLAKKGTTRPTSLSYQAAIEEAMCFGWIDGQARKRDESTYSQRFTPRTAKSVWSKRNVGIVDRLEQEGRMREVGRRVVEAAKADGRWKAAYAGSAMAEAPADFMAAVEKVPAAATTWSLLNKQNRFAIYYRLQTLKTTAGRERRIAAFVEMLARGEMPLPQKSKVEPEAEQHLADSKTVATAATWTRSGRAAAGV